MSGLRVNLATRPFRNDQLYYTAYALGVVLVLVMTAYNVVDIAITSAQTERLRRALAPAIAERERLLEVAEQTRRRIEASDVGRLEDEIVFARTFVTRRSFSWTELLNQFEALLPIDVRLSSIRPSVDDAGGITIRLDGLTRNQEALLRFEDELERAQRFYAVYPASERLREGSGWIEFDLSVRYLPETWDAAGTSEAS